MKKLLALIAAVCVVALAAPTAYAEGAKASETAELNFRGHSWSGEISEDTPDKLVITDNVVISKDSDIKNKNIRIENNGILEISDGAGVSLNGSQIFIENGGTLIVSDGALSILRNSSVKNVGTLIIGSKGKLDIKSSGFSSQPGSSFICSGKISCVSEKYFNRAIATIKRYDDKFSLSDYSMYVYASGSSATIQFRYCIDNIETSYRYTAEISNKNGLKVTHSSVKLSKVYDTTLRSGILDRVYTYEAVNDLPGGYDTGIERESYYLYDYSQKSLTAEYVYFELVFDTDEYLVYDIVGTNAID